jgi:hypothetical protein
VKVVQSADEVRLEVQACPVIRHLRAQGRGIVPCFCQHCYYVSEAMAAPAGLTVRIEGGDGSCSHRFMKRGMGTEPQRLNDIKEATS